MGKVIVHKETTKMDPNWWAKSVNSVLYITLHELE